MYIPRDVLHPWRERNHSWLELSQVHRETTHGVRVTVMPFFMGHREQGAGTRVFFWRYNIRIESLDEVRVQLKERQWRVYSEAGTLETVNGKGVIGQVRRRLGNYSTLSIYSTSSNENKCLQWFENTSLLWPSVKVQVTLFKRV